METTKKWQLIFAIAVGIAALILLGLLMSIPLRRRINNDCLKEVAENYCWDRGFIYDNCDRTFERVEFSCFESERSSNLLRFRFTDEEIERCMR